MGKTLEKPREQTVSFTSPNNNTGNYSVNSKNVILVIVIPCFNEEEVLPETARRLREKFHALRVKNAISEKSKIIFVDDGSTDNTWELIKTLYGETPLIFGGIRLSRNRGHQNALICGLLTVKNYCDAAISMDADLQDDIDLIDRMLQCYAGGYEIVYGVRSDRKTDGPLKRYTAQGFYRFMRFLGVDIVYNHADFRLMGRMSLDALAEYREVNLFLRGLIPMLGFRTAVEYYVRSERLAGKSKYPLKKMLAFSLEGITSLSVKPIRLITCLGLVLFGVSIGMIVYFLVRHFSGRTITGWSSTIVSVWGIGGLVLFSVGVVGEYIGKIYLETKHRPRYQIEQFLYHENTPGVQDGNN
ncbi:MAG: glycosyltransferase family 2 protein [Treponema sp.]|jgi:glycosyltransferase involved in cell wall biosynthesis|nr:glycosyltransferase family 2 protein [Treponema sp.]